MVVTKADRVERTLKCGAVVVVSICDAHVLARPWHLSSEGYPARARRVDGRNVGKIRLHAEIMKPAKGYVVDHINHDLLDNRRENLRVVTHRQNMMNQRSPGGSSRYKGVVWHKHRHRWQAAIKVEYQPIYLGIFDSEEQAARAYDAAAIEHFGEFALLNFPAKNNV